MKKMRRYGIVLVVICCVVVVAFIFIQDAIFAQQAEEADSLKDVFPEAISFEPVKSADNILYYKAYGSNSLFIGVVFKVTQKGYSGTIETMAGMRKDGIITAIKVLSQDETPGVGARITEEAFAGQFKGRNLQELNNVMVVTGATVSSRAVIESVKKKAEQVMALLRKEG